MSSKKININFDQDSQPENTANDPTPNDQNSNAAQQSSVTNNKELELLQNEVAQLKDSLARAQADFANFRRRQALELESTIKYANGQCIQELLPTIDNLNRAFLHTPEDIKDNQWVNGVLAIEKQFLQTLEKLGLKKISTVGQIADPNFHEIIGVTDQPNTAPDTIIDEIESGYMLHDKVLRVAKVRTQK